jgi:nucleotide-binding universal stress UspA family protein
MKNIIVLIDYSNGCKIALKQAEVIAKVAGSKLSAVHINTEGVELLEAHSRLKSFVQQELGNDHNAASLVYSGHLFSAIGEAIRGLEPNLVVFCSHGMHGIAQRMFGGHALKLAQAFDYPCLVLQENSIVREDGFKKILFPTSPYPDVLIKCQQTASFAKIFNAEIVLYEVNKYLANTEEKIAYNNNKTIEFFAERSIHCAKVVEESRVVSMGYSRQNLAYAKEENIDAIVMMSAIQDSDMMMLKADKEMLMSNQDGIPILVCSSNFKPDYHVL